MENQNASPQYQGVMPEQEREEETIKLGDFLSLCMAHWRQFIICIVLCLALGAFYIISTPKQYTRSASLIIKDNNEGNMSAVNDMIGSMGLFNSSTDVNNEMLAFQSPELFEATISRLSDNVIYTTRRLIKPTLLYGDSMKIKVDFISLTNSDKGSLRVNILNDNQVLLSKFKNRQGKKVSGDDITAALGDTVVTPLGLICVSKGPKFSADYDRSIDVNHLSMVSAIEYFSKKVKIAIVDDNATVISISMTDVSIARADDFINTLIEEYNDKWVEDKDKLALLTSQFISDRLQVIEKELGNVDTDISEFKSEHLLPDIQASTEMYLKRSEEITRQEREISIQISIAEYLRDYANKAINQEGLLPANIGLDSQAIERQITEYNTLHQKRDNLLNNSSKSNPIVAELDNQLASMRSAIIASLDNLVTSLKTELKTIKKSDRSTTDAIASSPSQAKYLLSVERQQKVKEALYMFLLQKREENELTRTFTSYNTRILNFATGSELPTSPKTMSVMLLCLIVGILIPAIWLFLDEIYNTRIRSREDLKGMTTPFVGEIPHNNIKKYNSLRERARRKIARLTGKTYRETATPEIVVKDQNLNIINEAFRMLRANLEFMSSEKGHKVIMITSFNPGSGKSFVTLNLAAAMAIKHKGSKVIAIDLDLRKATLSHAVSTEGPGLTSYLVGKENNITSLIRHTDTEGLDILPVGSIPPNPTELLYSERLKEIIEQLRQEYEYVFIDCPPAEIVADAALITKLCDMTIFVVRAGMLDRRQLSVIDEFYRTKRYVNLAVVLNGTYLNHSPYSRYGKYGYSYSYGSDYYKE